MAEKQHNQEESDVFSYVFMKILEGRPQSYDRVMNRVSKGHIRTAKESAAAEIPAGAHVLEIGCGTGELAAMLVERGNTVEGFDLNPSMIAAAQKRIADHGLGNRLQIRQMGVESMDNLLSAAYDAVIATLVLSELNPDERKYAIRQAQRVLKPGGRIVIADEVVPRTALLRTIHKSMRAPLAAVTYLVSSSVSRPVPDLAGDLVKAGFAVDKEERSQGDAFALLVARSVKEEAKL